MKICFTADEKRGLESILSYHFGHCPYYVIVDVDNNVVKNVESIDNPMAEGHNPGDLPEFMKKQGIEVIVTGGMGPKAQDFFKDFGIKTITGVYGVLQDVLEEFLQNKITVQKDNPETAVPHIEGEDAEVRKLKMEVISLREQLAELKSMVKNIEKKLD